MPKMQNFHTKKTLSEYSRNYFNKMIGKDFIEFQTNKAVGTHSKSCSYIYRHNFVGIVVEVNQINS